MRSNIIKKGTADEIRCAVTELRLSETFMDVPQLSVKVVSSTPITFEIGDYITYDYNGVTYALRSIPEAAKNARPSTYGEAFVYNLVFYSPMWDLRNAPFLDLVLYDNGQHFTSMPDVTTYEDVYGIAARVQANMDNMYPGKWEIRVVSGLSADSTLAQRLSETQDFSLSDGKCLDALSQVYSQWGVSFVYSYEGGKHVITIGGAETQEDTTGLFMYGRGNGLKVIKSSVQNASEIATRYYVYGGTQNMRPRYYNGRTMEPEYIHASDASNSTITGICSGRRLLGDNMYVPNLMIPVPKWGKSVWYVWTASSHSQAVFTEVRNPSAGDDFAFGEPNIGASRNVISSVSSGGIVVNGFTYQYLTEVLYPDIRKAYIDAPQSYLDKYGIRPATLRFDGSGEREDIHPSIKGLTVGDIRAGLGSGAEYYPSASVYTDPDERIDEVLSCDNPQDDGLTSSGANKYETVLTASVEQAVRNIDMTLEEREEDDPQEGTVTYKYYRADNVVILGNAFSVTVPAKSNLDFIFPLRLSVGMQTAWTVNARVSIYKTDASGTRSEMDSYERVLAGSGEAKDFNLAPSANSRYAVDAGEILSVDVVFTRVAADYSENVQPQFNVVIPAYTQQWRFAVSLGTEFYIKLRQIGFDISEVPTNDGESPVISMTSGQCGGYEFEIHDVSYNASDDSWTLRCARVQDGTLGQWFPNSIFRIEPDDTFVLLNIALPEVYITASEQRLYDAALAERLYEERPLLEPEIDSKVMAESPQVLRAGMWFSVKDTDLGLAGADGGSYLILIDSVEVTDKPDTIRSFKVTLRNNKEDNVFVRMQRQIAQTSASVQSERRSQTKTSVSEVPTKGGGGGGFVNTSNFVTLSTEQEISGRKTHSGDVVFGKGGSKMFVPSTAGEGVYDMYISDTPVQGEVPSSSSGIDEEELWAILGNAGIQKISKTHLPSDTVYTGAMNAAIQSALSPYATRTWVQEQGYLTSSALNGYATRAWVQEQGYVTGQYLGTVLSGYYTAEETDELLAGYVTLATAQTVTGAKTFAASLTKFNAVSGTNADLSGYISAVRLYVPSSAGGKVYDLYVSDVAVSGEAPSGSGGIDEEELWSILGNTGTQQIGASHLSSALAPYATQSWVQGLGYATQSWVQQQGYATQGWVLGRGYITASALTPYATKEWVQGLGYLTSVSLAAISDLHSSWDALLKAAPTAYVTRWPSFAEVTSRPTTLSGYGITDAYTKSEIAGLLAGYVTLATAQTVSGKKTFTSLLTASGGISGSNADFSGYVSAVKLYVPSGSGNNKVYDLYISDTAVSGEAPSGSVGIDEAELWTILTDGEGGEVIDISHIPDIPAGSVTGLLGTDGRISASLLPDFLLGQLLYGGTIGASSVATLSAAFKDRYGVTAPTLTVTASNAAAYEGVYFIASANGTSGIVSSLGVRTGDWVVSSGISWNKIDNTDSVSSVAGLTGVISRQSLQSALSDSAHRFVTDTQISAWNAKWDWDEADIKAVKVNGAVRADGLSTPRTIALSGGVTGTATAFDGTADISIPVTSVKEAYLSWGGRNIAGGVSPVDAAMVDTLGANRFAFMKPSAITVEYSRNGGQTWAAYPFSDTQKTALFSGIVTPCYIGASPEEGVDKSAYQLRITIDTSKAPLYTELKKIVIDCSSSGSTGCWCTVEGRTHGDVEGGVNEWAVFVNRAAIAGWSGYSVINTSLTTYSNSDAHYQQVRLTFGVTEHSAASAYPGLSIRRIMGYGGFGWSTPSAMAASGHLYSYDASGNAEFPAAVEAATFIGPLLGNATSATKLATARTLWGRPFDGMQNVSGAISSTGNISAFMVGTSTLLPVTTCGYAPEAWNTFPFRHPPATWASARPLPRTSWTWRARDGSRAISLSAIICTSATTISTPIRLSASASAWAARQGSCSRTASSGTPTRSWPWAPHRSAGAECTP